MSPLASLEQDIAEKGVAQDPQSWRAIKGQLREAVYKKGEVIFTQGKIGDRWLFVADGVAASEQTRPDGDVAIARFFEQGQFCGNLPSTWRGSYGVDQLVAVSDVAGVLAPHHVFEREYLQGAGFGEYLRIKVIETLLFDRDVIVSKTVNDTEDAYRFLEERHSRVLDRIPQKQIAMFIGVTPQGLSRFLRKSGRRSR